MKKVALTCLLVAAFAVSGFSQKAKFAHVDYGTIMKEMPGIDSIQKVLLDYQQELEAVGQQMAEEFKTKQEEYSKLATTSTSQAILKVREDEIRKLYQRLQDFVSTSEMDIQRKQLELIRPFQDKIKDAIKTVAENGKYAYVFDISMCSYHGDNDDLTAAVKKELGIN
ncbi:MAG: OmpH family outer membrane protein [Bacteroidales bacterium]|nr:OmpH family outer membrane protein [Bacteroidales bacterium]